MDEDRDFALIHAPADRRAALTALWRLDATLGRIVATTTDSMVGQMRLTWWHDAISKLPGEPTSGQPELEAIMGDVIGPLGIEASDIAALIEGWEALLDPLPLEEAQLMEYAAGRGGHLFALTGRLLGAETQAGAGEGWALSDFAHRCSDPATASRAYALARRELDRARIGRLPRPLRILARLANMDAIGDAKLPRSRWALLKSNW